MNLRQRLGRNGTNGHPVSPPTGMPLVVRPGNAEPDRYQTLKKQLHRDLIGKLDLSLGAAKVIGMRGTGAVCMAKA